MEQKVRWGILSTANIARETIIPAIQRAKNAEGGSSDCEWKWKSA
ncbi:putative dehydrogenase [Anoxybacillus caldiproteolyticus]|uniref:Putative dehydrogenase n=1 Tax=Thermaerobacillus caldiproteolyticus TaxID=247480 RepID=A0A7W0BYR5_9BACL|nr:putative dehydrogenase [Anoxybacillus caldiproteolyticus]